MSHFVEHMVFKGTESRPDPVQISAQIEGVGGVLNAGTEHELTVFWCKVAQPHFGDSLDLLFDMLRNSLYRPDDIENERHIIHEELAMILDYPTSRVDSLIDEMLWPNHPLGRDIGGTTESIDGITREALLEHMDRHYAPSNIVVSVAGNVTALGGRLPMLGAFTGLDRRRDIRRPYSGDTRAGRISTKTGVPQH